jgi:hypothetical protein
VERSLEIQIPVTCLIRISLLAVLIHKLPFLDSRYQHSAKTFKNKPFTDGWVLTAECFI